MATVKDILTAKGTDVVSAPGTETVLNAARLMNDRSIGGVSVTDAAGEVVGVFTERDVMRRVVAEHKDPETTQLREVMTTPVIRCRPEATLDECRSLMTDKRIRHIPVVDDTGLCGIITSGDILAYQVRDQQNTIDYLNSYVFDLR